MASKLDPSKCDFYAEIKKNVTFQRLVHGTSEFIDRAVIKCSLKKGMEVNAVESGNVGLIKWTFRPNCFSSWRCRKPKSQQDHLEIPIDFKNLLQAIKNANPDETIIIFKPFDKAHVEVRFIDEAAKDKAVTDKFEEFGSYLRIKLLDLEAETLRFREFGDNEPRFEMKAPEFHHLIASFCDTMRGRNDSNLEIDLQRTGVTFSVQTPGGFYSQVGKHYKHSVDCNLENKNTVVVHAPKGPFKEMYSLNYLKTFSKSCPVSEKVIVSVNTEMDNVLRVTFPIHNDSEISFFLGPRNQEDFED